MANMNERDRFLTERNPTIGQDPGTGKPLEHKEEEKVMVPGIHETQSIKKEEEIPSGIQEGRPSERPKGVGRSGARGTAAMDPKTRQEVARKGGLAVSRNRQHMAEIGRKGGMSVSKNREHMAQIGRKGGAASRGHR